MENTDTQMALASGVGPLNFWDTPTAQNIIKTYQNPDQRWSISVQNASLAPPGYYCLGVFFHVFSTFRCIKRLWYPKIEGGSPRNPFRTTSRAKEPEEDLTEDKSPDQEPAEAWGRPSCGAMIFSGHERFTSHSQQDRWGKGP